MIRGWIFWIVYATTFLSLIEVAELNASCDPNCEFLKAAKCIFLQKPAHECAKDETHYPAAVSALLENLPQNVRDSVINGTFEAQTVEDLVKIPPSLLNLIPTKQIHFSAENVSAYLRNHSKESAAAIKLISCLNSSMERKSFLENWNEDEFNSKIEDILASALTRWQRDADWNFLGLVQSGSTALLRIPPQFLLSFNSKEASEFLFHLGSKFKSLLPKQIARVFRNMDSQNLKFLRRAWAVLAVRELPEKIKWTKYSFVMPGLTLDELKNLEVDDVKPFLSYDFSPAQVRTIVSRTLVPWHIKIDQVAVWVKHLSPSQIQSLWRLNFKDLGIDANQTASFVTAKQILLYQLYNIDEENIKAGIYLNLTHSEDLLRLGRGFVSVLPVKMIQELTRSSVLTLESLQKIDSNLMSLSAAYYLTGKSSVFNLKKPSPKITGVRGMLNAIPTAKIMAVTEDVSSVVLHHLLQHLQGDNIPRNVEVLRKCRPTLGNPEYILKFLLENKDKNDYFRLLSLKDIARISLKTINSLARDNYGQRVKELPHHILAAILSNNSPSSWTWNNMLNSSNAFDTLLMGLNCNELRKIEDSDFISIIGRYNDERLKMGKVFPKNLQRCGQFALSDYLILKSNLYNEPELIDLLEPSDIEAVGGYVLASLSAEEILHAKYSKEIISTIGQLSLPELMLATSREHLSTLTDEYLNKVVKMSDLLLLRNLIHFISAPNLKKIGSKDVKYIIESDMIDKRLCADSETRDAWSRLLISIYGYPSKWNASQLESIGDLMIALSPDQLDVINSSQWQTLADIAVTKYTELVEWSKTVTFYQACASTLIKSEQKPYLEAVKSLQRKYFMEVQKLVRSIKLNVQNDSIVVLKTDVPLGSEPKPKPKVITTEDSYEEENEDLLAEDPAEFLESEETFLSPITEKSTTSALVVNRLNGTTSSPKSRKSSSVSSRNSHYSQPLDVTEKPSLQEYEESGEKLSSPDLPAITEIAADSPDETKPTVLVSGTENEQEHEVSLESSSTIEIVTSSNSPSSTDYTETPVSHSTADRKRLIEETTKYPSHQIYLMEETTKNPPHQIYLIEETTKHPLHQIYLIEETTENPPHQIYLSKNPFAKEDEDDDDMHPKVFGPEVTGNDSSKSKSNENFGDTAKVSHSNRATEMDDIALSENPFSKEEDDDVHPKVFGPEANENEFEAPKSSQEFGDSAEKSGLNPAVEPDNMADASDQLTVSSLSNFSESSKEKVVEKSVDPVTSSSSVAKIEEISDASVELSIRERVSFKDSRSTIDKAPFKEQTSSRTPLELSDLDKAAETFGDLLFGSFKRTTTTVVKLPSATEKLSAGKAADSNVLSSTTTETPIFDDIGDQLNAYWFGNDFASEAKKVRQGIGNLFGVNKAEESRTNPTTRSFTTDNSRPIVDFTLKPNKDSTQRAINETGESSTDFPTSISMIHITTPGLSSAAFEPSTTFSTENPTVPSTVENHSEKITATTPTTSAPFAKNQALESEEVLQPADFIDFMNFEEPENMTILESLSNIADMDYKQPQAEVYSGNEDENNTRGPEDYSGHVVDVEYPLEYFPSNVAAKRHVRRTAGAVSDFKPEARLFHSKNGLDESLARVRRNTEPASNNVFCDSVKVLGQSAELALQESDLHSVSNDELLNCVEDLGKLDLPHPFKEIIWQRVKSLEVVNMAVGSLAAAWKMDDVSNLQLNISNDWNLEVIYLLSKHNMDSSVGKIIVDTMKKQIFTDEMSEVSEAVMVAMGPLLCYLNIKELQLMFRTPGTFMHVIPIITEMMQGCQMECLSKFAKLAVAFIDPADSWTSDIVALLGPIPAGLDAENWKLLTGGPRAMSGLQPKALECLPQPLLQMMSVETMSILPPLTTKVLTDRQLTLLDKERKDVLIDIKYEHWSLRNTSAMLRSNSDQTLSPTVEVDLSSSCDIVTPSVFIAVFSVALLLS